jgi:hypothetical protein
MKLSLLIGTLALAAMALPGTARAQDHTSPDSFTHTVTGCLKNGTDRNVFSLTDENGKMWELRSKTVQLGQHVNHKVSVTGKIPKKAKSDGNGSSDDATVENRLRVTSLKMINESCTQP